MSSKTADDWTPYSKSGEPLKWFGCASARHCSRRAAFPIILVVLMALCAGHIAQNFSSLKEFCPSGYYDRCAKVFFLQWPGLIISAGAALCTFVALPNLLFGWVFADNAVNDQRALRMTRTAWATPPGRLLEGAVSKKKSQIKCGRLSFGASKLLYFIGLSPRRLNTVVSVENDLSRVQPS